MLEPDHRRLLVDALRPPDGFRLDYAVATTFTLDLNSALMIPLALAGAAAAAVTDPISIMESLRSAADRLDLFCQAGALVLPVRASDLVALLEPVVHEVRRPRPGYLFHPKVWALRYIDPSDAEAYRVLVLSRNLTGDRSWDVVLRLDGDATGSPRKSNRPLADFIAALPGLSRDSLPASRRNAIEELADDLRRVEWEPLDDVREIVFHPIGMPGRKKLDVDALFGGYRRLVVSPFVTDGGLSLLMPASESNSRGTVIARAEQLDRLAADTLRGVDAYVVSPLAGIRDTDVDADESAIEGDRLLADLHAKIVIVERAKLAHVFLGSANATEAAYGGNIEFMCELVGGVKEWGVDALVGDDAEFRRVLDPYAAPNVPPDTALDDARWKLEQLLFDAAQVGFELTASEVGDEWAVRVATAAPLPPIPAEITLDLAPYNRPAERQTLASSARVDLTLGPRPGVEVTPFLILTARTQVRGHLLEHATTVRAALAGGPEDRLGEILLRQLDTPEKFLRFLLLMLGLEAGPAVPGGGGDGDGSGSWFGGASSGVFELLVLAVATNPTAIDRLEEMVVRLRRSERGCAVLPADWDRVWEPVLAARRGLAKVAP